MKTFVALFAIIAAVAESRGMLRTASLTLSKRSTRYEPSAKEQETMDYLRTIATDEALLLKQGRSNA